MKSLDVYPNGRLVCELGEFNCAIGKNGVIQDKKEGDWATPIGEFALRRLLYRPDKLQLPQTNLPTQALNENDGWCDDPTHEHYNHYVQLPHEGSHENLWRANDDLYDLIIPMGYNDDPAIPDKGSAVFLHVARPEMTPTAGCIALKKDELLKILAILDLSSTITVHSE